MLFNPSAHPPCYQLLGEALPGGWKVIEKRPSPWTQGRSGGQFSTGYIVESKEGRTAFLKALDMWGALSQPDAAAAMNAMTQAYVYERDLLAACANRRHDRLVVAIESNQILVSGFPVPYLIFERADGDVREHVITLSGKVEFAWKPRSLHHIATALQQLHLMNVAHLDLKPSNVLVFNQRESKVGDLGRASTKDNPQPHDNLPVVGDRTYAPPELLYGDRSADWNVRCLACDIYHLGSMLCYYFLQFGTTVLVCGKLHPLLRPQSWTGRYLDVLPFLRGAFNDVVTDFEQVVPAELRTELVTAFRQLCDPDPALRGHPAQRQRIGNPFNVERYVSSFNNWAARAELGMVRSAGMKP